MTGKKNAHLILLASALDNCIRVGRPLEYMTDYKGSDDILVNLAGHEAEVLCELSVQDTRHYTAMVLALHCLRQQEV